MPYFFRIMNLCGVQPQVELRRALRVMSTVKSVFRCKFVERIFSNNYFKDEELTFKMDCQDLPAELWLTTS